MRTEAIFAALASVQLLAQIEHLQDALWQHTVVWTGDTAAGQIEAAVRFVVPTSGLSDQPMPVDVPATPLIAPETRVSPQAPQAAALVALADGPVC